MEQRRIGPGIIRAVEQLEQAGEIRISAGRPPKREIRERRDYRALRRAVQYGLATRTKTKPYVYRPAHDWRAVLSLPEWTIATTRPVASVWDWAQS